VTEDRDRNLLQRGATALRAGDLSAAERFCSEVLERAPGDAEALNIMGAIAFTRRSYKEAERLFTLSASASPDNLGSLFNLGKVFEVQKRLDDAATAYAKILATQPKNQETLLRFGIVRYQQGEFDDAIGAFERILQDDPSNETASLSLGVAYNAVGRYEESVRELRGLLSRHPDYAEARHALADSLYELHRVEEAANVCRAALVTDRNDVQATILLGQVECDRGNYTAAEKLFRAAAARDPERHEPAMNLGVLFQRLGRIEEALKEGKRALDLAPSEPLAHVNYGMALLLAGDLTVGWPQFEWRAADPKMRDHFPYRGRLPMWTGEELDGTLLISREQGLGDFILFSRFFPQAMERVRRLVVEVPPELYELYDGMARIDWCSDRCDPETLSAVKAHVSLCSLPLVLGTGAQVGARVPYLTVPDHRRERFRDEIKAAGNALRVGIVWAGSPGHLLDRYRSAPTRAYAALSELPDIAWFSLQKGAHEPMRTLPIVDLGAELRDFADTAAAIEKLDLILSVDTAVAHLAGAMGKPVWLLSGFGSYWLWQLERSDSPWYPTMRLFRQQRPDDWTSLFGEVREALKERTQA
jgi:tetratricopeptide (TPR) repeat protein